MGDRHDYVALDWVKGEISETLNQARQALEAFVENPEDSTRLRFCLTYIHQVHGTLQMVEFYGAALLAEEMEQLAQALMNGSASREGEALEVLMQAILQMPAYLDRVQSARRDLPMVLLPLLNDMRTARGDKLLSENAVFSPALDGAESASRGAAVADLSDEASVRQLRKLRQALQMAQANVIRGQDVPQNSRHLRNVFVRLEALCADAPYAQLWSIFAGVAEGLEIGSIDNSAAVRQLLRQADQELRQLMARGATALQSAPPRELLRNLLFYVAKSADGSPRLDALKERYQLKGSWNEEQRGAGDRLVGPDREAMQSVALALGEELMQVKDQLDLFVRSDRRDLTALEGMLPVMKRIADTLAMLGLGQPRRVLTEQIEQVMRLASGQSAITDAALMDVAGGMLYVEASLQGILGVDRSDQDGAADSDMQGLAAAQDIALVHQLVVQEARNALEETRESINAFIANQWDHSQLAPVDALLTSVRGGLAMVPLARAAAAIAACRRYITEQLIGRSLVPDWPALDALADVITSIDYYLERLAEDDSGRGDSILDVAEERLGLLGYHPQNLPEEEVAEQPASVEDAEEAESEVSISDEPLAEAAEQMQPAEPEPEP
ncbi:MAG TPA: hybrid sensor histidine kinase/response regulator, partial [Pseudomonas sp.]|nr:hybrid sensor histidine kinase/response regulator [Pseudomonas sp.]